MQMQKNSIEYSMEKFIEYKKELRAWKLFIYLWVEDLKQEQVLFQSLLMGMLKLLKKLVEC